MAFSYYPNSCGGYMIGTEADLPVSAPVGCPAGTFYIAYDTGRLFVTTPLGALVLVGSGGENVYSAIAASTANVNTASAPAAIDGITLAAGEIVLLKNQTIPTENGLYVFAAAAAALTRLTSWDGVSAIVTGTRVIVRLGTANANTEWAVASDTNPVDFTAATDIQFVRAAGNTYFGTANLDGAGAASVTAPIKIGSAITVTEATAANAIAAPAIGRVVASGVFTVAGTALSAFDWVVTNP